ncbi:MAG: hypothetical protein ACRC0J_07935 [Shewanella oncorhynchi]
MKNFEAIKKPKKHIQALQPDGSLEEVQRHSGREKLNKPKRNNMKRFMNENYLAGDSWYI